VRILFAAVAAYGRVIPLLPLADAARAAGHEVLFATGESMFPALRRAGFDAVKVGMPVVRAFERAQAVADTSQRSLDEQMPEIGTTVFGDLVPRAMFATVKPVIERFRADLVVAEIGNPGAWFAAEYLGVPAMGTTWGPVVSTPHTSEAAARTAKVAADLGVSGVVPYLDICPESLQSPSFRSGAERIPLRPVPWSFPDDELPAMVSACERPIVYVTVSSVLDTATSAMLRAVATGLARLPVEVLMTTGAAPGDLGELPPNVHVLAWAPQSLLIPHTSLVVHHGGPGAMLNTLSSGLPQLVLPDPQGVEPGTSDAVLAAGVGRVLPQDEVTADAVHDLAAGLLADDAVRAAAAVLADEIAAMPAPAQVLELLEKR
jgi:UDP:flavonoid glycosyltransferase YjiC (YdhE family)